MASCFKLFRIGALSHWVQELQVQELQVTQLTCMLCQGAPQIIVCMKGLCNFMLSFIMSAKLENQQHWRKCCSHKRKMLLFYPLFGTWLWYFYKWCNWLLGGDLKSWSITCCFFFFPSKSIVLSHALFCQIFSVHACHHLFRWSLHMGVCLV